MDSRLVHKYITFVDQLSRDYGYDSNISHLLYLIVPAFVTKYSIYKESLILNTFKKVKILISDQVSLVTQAYYTSIPSYEGNMIITHQYIVIQNYQDISLVQLLDNLVHEFNHAINSYQKEMITLDDTLLLRTGLTYARYSIPDLVPIKKDDSYILEEILNTHQTEEIINIIKNYHDDIDDKMNATIYSFNYETDNQFTSQAYYLESIIFKPILENKTFISTLNSLRFSGDISDIDEWFNHITGIKNSYFLLNQYLKDMMNLEEKLEKNTILKNRNIRKIKEMISKVTEIITIFNQNCNYK